MKALQSLSQIGPDVVIEANDNGMILRTLNLSRTAFAQVTFDKKRFFEAAEFSVNARRSAGNRPCVLRVLVNIKACLGVIKNPDGIIFALSHTQSSIAMIAVFAGGKSRSTFVVRAEPQSEALTLRFDRGDGSLHNELAGRIELFSRVVHGAHKAHRDFTIEFTFQMDPVTSQPMGTVTFRTSAGDATYESKGDAGSAAASNKKIVSAFTYQANELECLTFVAKHIKDRENPGSIILNFREVRALISFVEATSPRELGAIYLWFDAPGASVLLSNSHSDTESPTGFIFDLGMTSTMTDEEYAQQLQREQQQQQQESQPQQYQQSQSQHSSAGAQQNIAGQQSQELLRLSYRAPQQERQQAQQPHQSPLSHQHYQEGQQPASITSPSITHNNRASMPSSTASETTTSSQELQFTVSRETRSLAQTTSMNMDTIDQPTAGVAITSPAATSKIPAYSSHHVTSTSVSQAMPTSASRSAATGSSSLLQNSDLGLGRPRYRQGGEEAEEEAEEMERLQVQRALAAQGMASAPASRGGYYGGYYDHDAYSHYHGESHHQRGDDDADPYAEGETEGGYATGYNEQFYDDDNASSYRSSVLRARARRGRVLGEDDADEYYE